MATNPYFSYAVKSEQNLYEDLVIESLKMYGNDVYYLPRTIVNEDTILGDDIPSTFSSSYKIEMYVESYDGFAGEGDLFQKFGIEIRDQATFILAKKRWKNVITDNNNDIDTLMPREGDLIYLPLSRSLFQIMRTEHEQPFYQLSNFPTFKLHCELFEYNDENIDTGIANIDVIETLGYEVKLTVSDSAGNTLVTLGETVTQTLSDGTVISGKITAWDDSDDILSLAHVSSTDGDYHLFTVGSTITHSNTSDTRTIIAIDEDLGDFHWQNNAFDSDVGFLDFSETNPFGDPS